MSDKSKIYDYIKRTINPYGKPFEGTAYELGLKIMDYIENMDDEKENGWIPVSERLPEIGQKILCQSKNRSGEIFVGIYRDKGKYKDSPYFDWKQNGFPSVISWMPLPEPYKED